MFAIVGGKIFTGDEFIEQGVIFVENGRILKVLRRKRIPKNIEVVDLSGRYILPGLVDAHTHLGLRDEGAPREYSDINEATDPSTPHLYALDAFNPNSPDVEKAIRSGVTTVFVTPGSANPIGGMGSVIRLKPGPLRDMVLKREAGLKIAMGENPKTTYREKKTFPATRMGVSAVIREWFYKALKYSEKKRREKDLKLENLLKVLKREIPARIHCHSVQDIETALRLKDEFGIDIVLEHGTDAVLIKEKVAGNVKGIVVGPLFGVSTKPESKNLDFKNPGILSKAGIKVALTSDHPFNPVYYLNLYAALAHKEGMDEIEALKAITSNPAEILGVEREIGYIKPGLRADMVVFNTHPFDINSKIEMVFLDGIRIL